MAWPEPRLQNGLSIAENAKTATLFRAMIAVRTKLAPLSGPIRSPLFSWSIAERGKARTLFLARPSPSRPRDGGPRSDAPDAGDQPGAAAKNTISTAGPAAWVPDSMVTSATISGARKDVTFPDRASRPK